MNDINRRKLPIISLFYAFNKLYLRGMARRLVTDDRRKPTYKY